MHIIVATTRASELESFLGPLKQLPDAKISFAETGGAALELVKSLSPSFVIVDEHLADHEPLDLVTEIVKINAMVNTAVFSSMDARLFHDESEGLGILAPIAPAAGEEDGIKLKEIFERFI